MHSTISPRRLRSLLGVAVTAVMIAGAASVNTGVAGATGFAHHAPIVRTENGRVRGIAAPSAYQFLGIPYAAPPTGNLRWRPPQPAPAWSGVRDATTFGPSCPQATHTKPVPSARPDQRGLPVPQRLHADATPCRP